jgi:zinc/manganese transport system substrate-binding protein
MRTPRTGAAVLAASSLLLVAGCGSADADDAGIGVSVVASTDVYGDIVAAIGGDDVEVTSIITGSSADPHSFEASARTQLAVSRADLVVENGGGYDDFVDTLLSATGSDATVLTAVDVPGRAAVASGQELNEHVWYDLETVAALADEIVSVLTDIDPERAATYAANGADLHAQLQDLVAAEREARSRTAGAPVVVTEPVPGYLLDALGADDRTPAAFSEAIEEGGDVSPAVLRDTLDLFSGDQVRALVYNEQTTGAQTEQVLAAARAAGVAVVPVTETLPEGDHYVSWMRANIAAVGAALSA